MTVISTEQVRCLRVWEQRTSDSRGPGKRRAAIRPRLVSTYPARIDLNPGGGPSQVANNRVGGAAKRLTADLDKRSADCARRRLPHSLLLQKGRKFSPAPEVPEPQEAKPRPADPVRRQRCRFCKSSAVLDSGSHLRCVRNDNVLKVDARRCLG